MFCKKGVVRIKYDTNKAKNMFDSHIQTEIYEKLNLNSDLWDIIIITLIYFKYEDPFWIFYMKYVLLSVEWNLLNNFRFVNMVQIRSEGSQVR